MAAPDQRAPAYDHDSMAALHAALFPADHPANVTQATPTEVERLLSTLATADFGKAEIGRGDAAYFACYNNALVKPAGSGYDAGPGPLKRHYTAITLAGRHFLAYLEANHRPTAASPTAASESAPVLTGEATPAKRAPMSPMVGCALPPMFSYREMYSDAWGAYREYKTQGKRRNWELVRRMYPSMVITAAMTSYRQSFKVPRRWLLMGCELPPQPAPVVTPRPQDGTVDVFVDQLQMFFNIFETGETFDKPDLVRAAFEGAIQAAWSLYVVLVDNAPLRCPFLVRSEFVAPGEW
jgi:hypothetical protein